MAVKGVLPFTIPGSPGFFVGTPPIGLSRALVGCRCRQKTQRIAGVSADESDVKRHWNVILLTLAAGCGGSPVTPSSVTGTVTFHGQPLAGGIVAFTPDVERGHRGRPIAALIQSDGRFALPENVPPGWYRVSLSDQAGAWTADGRHFPNHLRRPDQSGLIREVKPGQTHVLDFQIDWKR
jgi:hypothetical protein